MHAQPAVPTLFADVRNSIVRNAVFVGLAVSVYGVSFGALGITAGLTVQQTSALSILMFTGASQLAFVGIISAGGSPATAIATALLLGVRNAMYAVRMSTILRVRGGWRLLAAQLTIDESTALSIAQDESIEDGRAARLGFWSGGLAVFVLWNLATLAGAISAQALGDPKALGLDTAIAAGLAGLLWPRLRDRESWAVAAGAVALALLLAPFMPAGVPVLACSLYRFRGRRANAPAVHTVVTDAATTDPRGIPRVLRRETCRLPTATTPARHSRHPSCCGAVTGSASRWNRDRASPDNWAHDHFGCVSSRHGSCCGLDGEEHALPGDGRV